MLTRIGAAYRAVVVGMGIDGYGSRAGVLRATGRVISRRHRGED